mmetsp:Transcript_6605/g.25513  ORF Transcript_6605/g.25513 Transcript_6605/m.25513 type:complete len:224 (-) Transcript_6605:533-1204(-)
MLDVRARRKEDIAEGDMNHLALGAVHGQADLLHAVHGDGSFVVDHAEPEAIKLKIARLSAVRGIRRMHRLPHVHPPSHDRRARVSVENGPQREGGISHLQVCIAVQPDPNLPVDTRREQHSHAGAASWVPLRLRHGMPMPDHVLLLKLQRLLRVVLGLVHVLRGVRAGPQVDVLGVLLQAQEQLGHERRDARAPERLAPLPGLQKSVGIVLRRRVLQRVHRHR